MASTESFDPRTWKEGESAPDAAPVAAVMPVAAAPAATPASGPAYRWWLGPALSAAVLAGGALVAYQTRSDAAASAVSPVASAQ